MSASVRAQQTSPTDGVLASILRKLPEPFPEIVTRPEHELQVFYVQVDRTADGPKFKEHAWRVSPERYFYPASTVKFPVALFALEKLGELRKKVPELRRDSAMLTDKAQEWQTDRHKDASALSGLPSIANDVRNVFLVSDNDAYNRLFEFVGSGAIRDRLTEMRLADSRIFHRLAVRRELEHSRYANPIRFVDQKSQVLYRQADSISPLPDLPSAPILKGRGYLQQGTLINEPKDFSGLNAFPLRDQHRVLRSLIFPGSVPSSWQLRLTDDDREFVKRVMSQYPRECTETASASIRNKADTYVKDFLAWETTPIRDSLRCYNKSGEAYGYLIDNAYIVDREFGIEFFLAACIHVNANGIYNDDVYEYETLGQPFMTALGRAIHAYERSRKP